MKKSMLKKLVLAITCIEAVACTQMTAQPASNAQEFIAANDHGVASVVDAPTALAAARSLGFLGDLGCAGGLKGGEEVMFTLSQADLTERGQASGVLLKTPSGIFFAQKAIQRRDDRAQAPGIDESAAGSFDAAGGGTVSHWEFTSYLTSVCRIAFNLDGILPSPLYTSAEAAIVDVTGGTAGIQYAQTGVLRLRFAKDLAVGNKATMTIYLKKDFGIVGLETSEAGGSHGNLILSESSYFHLYINDAGGSGVGADRSFTPADLAAIAASAKKKTECDKIPGSTWRTDDLACIGKKPNVKDLGTCIATGGRYWIGSECYELLIN